jgi:hypothetical protein
MTAPDTLRYAKIPLTHGSFASCANFVSSRLGTLARSVRAERLMRNPWPSGSRVTAASVLSSVGVKPAPCRRVGPCAVSKHRASDLMGWTPPAFLPTSLFGRRRQTCHLGKSFQPLNANRRHRGGLAGPVHFCAAFIAQRTAGSVVHFASAIYITMTRLNPAQQCKVWQLYLHDYAGDDLEVLSASMRAAVEHAEEGREEWVKALPVVSLGYKHGVIYPRPIGRDDRSRSALPPTLAKQVCVTRWHWLALPKPCLPRKQVRRRSQLARLRPETSGLLPDRMAVKPDPALRSKKRGDERR